MICWGETTFMEFYLDSLYHVDELGIAESHLLATAQKAKITALSVGRRMFAVVTEDGKGKLCFRDEMSETGRQQHENFALSGEKIDALTCGADCIVMVSEKGNVFQLNCRIKPYIPRCLSALNGRHVIQVACGDHHTIALSRDGQLFTWGKNSNGQLGQGEVGPSSQTPKRLFSLSGIPLAMITAGGDQSFALSVSGAVFAWGKNSAGQLGVGDKEDRHVPTTVKSLNLKRTVFISCGDEHTAILTKGGLVFTFGSGEYGQLGHSSNREELQPRLVAELWGSSVTQIACGRHHTLAYVESLKTIYSFGCGEQGQLGSGQATNQNVPLPVQLSSGFDDGIGTILAGGNQSIFSRERLASLSKKIVSVDNNLIEKWISTCGSKPWKAIRKEIMQTFSSASTLNCSFLNQSGGGHDQTSMENSGLDLSLARIVFEKLGNNEKLLKEVASVVQHTLIPSLPVDPSGVEDLRVYLILPELLRVLPTDRDLCVKFAEAVCRLQPQCLKILEGLWSKLPRAFFKSLVKVVHSASTWFFYQMRTELRDYRTSVEKTVEFLQKLYEVNHKSGRKIEYRNFYINEMKLYIKSCGTVPPDANFIYAMKQFMVQRLALYPSIFDMETKWLVFWINNLSGFFENALLNPLMQNHLCVNRRSLLTDTFQELRNNPRQYLCPLEVKFKYENGIDHGGVSQEFFSVIAREIHSLQPKMLELFEDSGLVWFMPEGHCDDDDAYSLLGILCGMALYRVCFVNFHFPLALFKKMLGVMPTLEDLKELSPIEARNLQELLNEDEEVLELLDLDFTARGHEIVPNGREMTVTKCNRWQFVEAYVDFIFNKSVKKQFDDFLGGFSQGCPNQLWKMFLPEELMARLSGNIHYFWEELEKNALYEAYEPTDKNIQNFWTVFFELSEEKKKDFLSFMTGSDRLPIGGLASIKITIVNQNKPNPDDFYPVANTCYRCLYLPNYSSIHVLREKFVHAISFYEEFGEY
ncbi:probable E3 ubiquitin-protein ligase HERC3 isoform X1 [Conger conger]|uniref:probable E3 ubiquitin-protein ligase HERC3 isoform X1 n=1 Tax=Conger conger TaxID=82655 RepID=UPI002A5AE83F|nr:probable E3 ubiquitin-protein ligase HERC3 isoform X1 [Conger conger]